MAYIPQSPIKPIIGHNNKFKKHPRCYMPRIKKVSVEPVVEEERIALDNKYRASFLDRLYGLKQPNYSIREVTEVLEKER